MKRSDLSAAVGRTATGPAPEAASSGLTPKTRASGDGRLRLLPLVIVAATLLLGMKVASVWTQGFGSLSSPAVAQDMGGDAGQETGARGQDEGPVPDRAPTPGADGEPMQSGANEAGPASNSFPDDPTLFTQSEIDLLQKLAERRAELERRERELAMKENLLKAAESRIEKKIGELSAIQADIRGMLDTHDEKQEAKLASLTKIYERMKPKDAARIMMALEGPVLLDVMERMREAVAASIMAEMTAEKARDITLQLAVRRQFTDDADRLLAQSRPKEDDPEAPAATEPDMGGTNRGAPPSTRPANAGGQR